MKSVNLPICYMLMCFGNALSQHVTEVDISSCSLTCGQRQTGAVPSVAGRPGKRGAKGNKGDVGNKGGKGDQCICEIEDAREIVEIKTQMAALHPECHQTRFYLPRKTQTSDYFRIKTALPELHDFTVCTRIKGSGTNGKVDGTVISYAVGAKYNRILLIADSQNVIGVNINDQYGQVTNIMQNGVEYHACFTRSIAPRSVKWYVNGVMKKDLTSSYSQYEPIPAGGVFILGQDQDASAGGFDSTQAFAGEFQNPTVWSRALSDTEISILSDSKCSCIPDAVVLEATPDAVQLEGAAALLLPDDCF
uniref:C-reactive protein b n=1 Tax=Halocynthia roretzi TaxID=7729 RepID=A4F2Q5_HALRO|nr:C-reactive protein b [Halocynthia roretzi]